MTLATKTIAGGLALVLLSTLQLACSVAPTHPAFDGISLPEQLPVRNFVANTDYTGGFTLSPDGRKLAWEGVSGLKPAILWRFIDSPEVRVAGRFDRNSPSPFWSADGRYLLYQDDPSGRENLHVFAIDTARRNSDARDLTPHENVRAYVQHVPSVSTSRIYILHNRRDPAAFDLYEIDIDSGVERLLYENRVTAIALLVDDKGAVRARVRQQDDVRRLEVPDGDEWRTLIEASLFDDLFPLELTLDGAALYVLTNVDRDKRALSLVDLRSGELTELFAHERVDVGNVLLSPSDRRPLLAGTEPDYPEIHFFDADIERALSPLQLEGRGGLGVMSMDRDARRATVSTYDHGGAEYHLVELDTGESQVLGRSPSRKHGDIWARPEAITVTASDGMQLYGYLTRPAGSDELALPTVLRVNGGPWARDRWGHDDLTQFLVNRGYAVLQINYRGSAGYGRAYMNAGVREFAGRVHRDLIDTVDWAIDEGISDPQRVGIFGGSYGGYATLVGITMTPARFACGIDVVGVSDLATLLESAPPYWKPWMHLWTRFVGDPADPVDRQDMDDRSPLNFAAQAQSPLLIVHGANDPRVNRDQSDRMVAALREAGKAVDYLVIDDEGHGFAHWKNQLKLYRQTEDFFADCLGGRSSGFDVYELGSWAF